MTKSSIDFVKHLIQSESKAMTVKNRKINTNEDIEFKSLSVYNKKIELIEETFFQKLREFINQS